MKISLTKCRQALVPSKLGGYDYALNPYKGCTHNCLYCYAPYITHEKRVWGNFLDVRENMPRILAKELKLNPKGVVGISTVTDPYQKSEEKFELTRRCLEQLVKNKFPFCIQTKSTLVTRDIDLIKKSSSCEVGVTLTTFDVEDREKYEPGASTVEDRLQTIEEFSDAGVKTWVFIGPIMPYITTKDNNLERLINAVKDAGTDYVMIDKLNIKQGMRPNILKGIKREFPNIGEKYENLPTDYFQKLKPKIARLCNELDLKHEFCF